MKKIKSNLISMDKLLKKAYKEKKAIGQFNINNLEWTIAILKSASSMKTPVILGVSVGAANYMGGYKTVFSMVNSLIQDLDIKTSVVLHLDHGNSFKECKKAIDAGFSSVMIDASAYPLKENIKKTNKVVNYAKKFGVSVEAEVGQVGGQEDDIGKRNINYAKLEDCKKFVDKCDVDALAIGYGSVHGEYKGEPNLNFKLLKEVNKELKIPLVLHGASGIFDSQIKKSIDNGICKININTQCQIAWSKKTRSVLKEDLKVYDPRKIIAPGMENIKEVVQSKIKLFNN